MGEPEKEEMPKEQMEQRKEAIMASVRAISVDSHFVHKIWQEKELSKMVEGGVSFPMLSHAGGKIGSVYGVYNGPVHRRFLMTESVTGQERQRRITI